MGPGGVIRQGGCGRVWSRGLRGLGRGRGGMTEKEKLQELGRRERVTESRVRLLPGMLVQGNSLTELRREREGVAAGGCSGSGEGAVGRGGVLGSGEAGEYGGPGGRSPASPAALSSSQPGGSISGVSLPPPPIPQRCGCRCLWRPEGFYLHMSSSPRASAENGWGPHCTVQPKGV